MAEEKTGSVPESASTDESQPQFQNNSQPEQPTPQYNYAPQTGNPNGAQPTAQSGAQYNQQYYQQPNQQYSQQNYQYGTQQQYAQQPVSNRTAGLGSAQKEKWVAAVLAFTPILGALGIHKFYLGYKTEGLIMLLVTILGSCLFGLGFYVMTIISLVEAVRYVTLTQEDFEATYVRNSKSWF